MVLLFAPQLLTTCDGTQDTDRNTAANQGLGSGFESRDRPLNEGYSGYEEGSAYPSQPGAGYGAVRQQSIFSSNFHSNH